MGLDDDDDSELRNLISLTEKFKYYPVVSLVPGVKFRKVLLKQEQVRHRMRNAHSRN